MFRLSKFNAKNIVTWGFPQCEFLSFLTWVVRKSHEIKTVFLDFSLSCPFWLALSPVFRIRCGLLSTAGGTSANEHFSKEDTLGAFTLRWRKVSLWKRSKYFPSNTTSGKFKNATITGHFGFVSVAENSVRQTSFPGSLFRPPSRKWKEDTPWERGCCQGSHMIIVTSSFWKRSVCPH